MSDFSAGELTRNRKKVYGDYKKVNVLPNVSRRCRREDTSVPLPKMIAEIFSLAHFQKWKRRIR